MNISKMLPIHVSGKRLHALLVTSSVTLAICFALIGMSLAFGWGGPLYVVAFIFGIASYASFMRWVAQQDHRTRLMWNLERLRQMLGYEGDPGPFPY